MRTNLHRAATALLAVLATLTTLATFAVVPTSAASAAAAEPLHAVAQLYPDGSEFERYVSSPVEFGVRADDRDRSPDIRLVVQRLTADGVWRPAYDGEVPSRGVGLADGSARWRARAQRGTDVGPWSGWAVITVDSRVPATPIVTIPAGPVVLGRPVPVTVSSPDGLAGSYFLSRFNDIAVSGRGDDPCQGPGSVCPSQLGGTVTVPIAFLTEGSDGIYAHALSRAGVYSGGSAGVEVTPGPDVDAIPAAARWTIPASGGSASRLAEVHGGTALRVGPTTSVGVQDYPLPTTGGDRATDGTADTVDVPSIDTTVSTNVRTVGPVVDTAATFSVGAVVTSVANPPADVTLLDQPGADGPAFTLTLTRDGYVKFCAYTTDATTTCSSTLAVLGAATFAVVANYDAVGRRVSVSAGRSPPSPRLIQGTTAPLRAASGGLRFGAAAAPGTQRYRGLVGSPFVARGWVTGADLASFLTPAA